MVKQYRTSEEVAALITKLQAEVDAIKAKWEAADPVADDVSKMNEMLATLEGLAAEKQVADTQTRLAKFKESQETPATPAPQFAALPATPKKALSAGEVFHAAIAHNFKEGLTSETQYRMAKAGINLSSIHIPTKFEYLNATKRKQYRTLSRGANPGNDLPFSEYSDNVVEIMAYASPLLSVLNIENSANGNVKSYFTLDDSAGISTDVTAGGGTELIPTLPDLDVSDGVKKNGVFTITSGYQKITREELQDSYVSLESNFARWSGRRHALKMEKEALQASGNGETGRQGLLSAATDASPITGGFWTYEGLKSFYFGIPIQYRKNLVFVVNGETYGQIHVDLEDGNDRSYFDVNVVGDQEYETFLNKKMIVSDYVTDDTVLAFDPEYFVMRTVNSQSFDMLTEKFYPHLAGIGIMRFGCMWNGPALACQTVALTS